MQFAAPSLLGLLALALAPILVHLLYKRRRATIDFPSLRLLRHVELRLSPRRKLREILLLVARCLFVAMLVLAVARPVSTGSTGSSSTPVDHVLVIDNTASMNLADGAASAFEIAKRRAAETIDALASRDRAALVPTVTPDGWTAGALTNDRTRLRQALDALPASDAGADLAQVMDTALEMADDASAARREVMVFSDFRGAAGRIEGTLGRALRRRSARTGLLLVDCATPLEKPNVALSLVDVDPPAPLVGRPVEIVVALVNGSADELVRGVSLELAGVPIETRSVTVPGAGRAVVRLRVHQVGQVGWTHGRATLSDDGFDGDNQAAFTLRVRDRLRVLVVDPAMEATVPDPEAPGRFLTRLLDPSGDGNASGIEAERMRPTEAALGLPREMHAVFVCGYSTAEGLGTKLESFASRGGFVAVFPEDGDTTIGAAFRWLPARPGAAASTVEPPGSIRWLREEDEKAHGLGDLTVRRSQPLDARKDAEVLLAFDGRAPALAVGSVGEGHALTAGFALTPSWGAFTFHPQIVALLHRLVARYAAPPHLVRPTAGEHVRVPCKGAGAAAVTCDGETLGEHVPVTQGVEEVYDLGRVLRAGVYAFDAETETDFQRFVPVNPDAGESALARPPEEALIEAWADARILGPDEEVGVVLASRRAGSEYAAIFLLLALFFALAEAILGNRQPTRRTKTPEGGARPAAAAGEHPRRRRAARATRGGPA